MKRIAILLLVLGIVSVCSAQKRLDSWFEEPRLFGISAGSASELSDISEYVALDYSDVRNGDFSVLYNVHRAASYLGFRPASYHPNWRLSSDFQLSFWIKAQGDGKRGPGRVVLLDNDGNAAVGPWEGIDFDGAWRHVTFDLAKCSPGNGFDFSSVKACKLKLDLVKGDKVWLDDVHFVDKRTGKIIGVTDKSIDQRMAEAEISRAARVEAGFRQTAKKAPFPVVSAFAKMLLNEDLETANKMLIEELEKSSDGNLWSLLHTPLYCRFYYNFSSRYGKYPGRMTAEAEKLLLETLWERTKEKNDIHWARQSTWYLDGSENHDLNAKACNLVTSRIFMNEPGYKDRVYPDYGFGGGYHYGHAGYYGPGVDPATRHGGGRANLSDGKEYTAKDHYAAWLAYMKTYFPERAERGFFLEHASCTYSKHTLNMVDLVYQYGGDAELHHVVGDFLTLYWADWAQVSISGVRGGPKTRHHHRVYGAGTDSLISFHMGDAANAGVWWYWNLINDYRLPKVVWMMALDRQGMGCYTYKARGIGEEENILPRPLGTERSLVVDTDARFLKNTYVTPDYTLGTQMDHPSAVHSHLSIGGRWHGMTFAQSPGARIVPVGVPEGPNKKGQKNPYELEIMYQTVQDGSTLVLQQSRRWYAVHPDWFPTNAAYDQPMGVWFGKDWDQQIEKDGWVFVQRGNAYAAVRPVLWDELYERERKKKTEGNQQYFNATDDDPTVKLRDDCYTWSADGAIMLLDDNHSPVIIEAGRAVDYPALADFIADVLDNPLRLYKTVVPGDHIITYTGCGDGAQEIVLNAAVSQIPTIGGEPVNYSYPMTYDSPYLKSKYKSGKIHIEYDGETLDLDFSASPASADQAAFEQAATGKWREVFLDAGTGDWTQQWFLDGEVASVKNEPEGMQLTAGPQFRNDAHHMVLWTKDSFAGDLKIEYEYTRLDFESRCVNILYIQATGSGKEPYAKDITEWNDLRRVPAMRMYYDYMNAYHISYAAFPNVGDFRESYIRARRYMPHRTGLEGTELEPDYYPQGLFEPGVPHKITVIKQDRDIFMRVENADQVCFYHMTNPDLPIVTEGRIGLRQMFTRSARYKDIRISIPQQ